MSKDTLADVTSNPEDEVPRLSRLRHENHQEVVAGTAPPKYEPVYYTIPREKWAVIETAHDAAEKVDQLISRIDNTGLLSVGVCSVTRGQQKQKAVNIRYPVQKTENGEILKQPDVSFEELKGNLPGSIAGTAGKGKHSVTMDGIPVEFTRREFHHVDHNDPGGGASPDYYYDYNYRPLPGSALIVDNTTNEVGTVATPAYDYKREEYVLTTVAHLTNGGSGHPIGQPVSNNIGKSDKGSFSFWDFDAATIDINTDDYGSHDVQYNFAGDGNNNYSLTEIWGTLAWDTIKDHEGDSSYNMQWSGGASGHHGNDHIVETNTDHYFWLNEPPTPGDSGGPMYHVEFSGGNGRAYIAGIVGQNDDGDDDGDADVAGTWIGDVEQKFNLNV